jgi:hypothetical protein
MVVRAILPWRQLHLRANFHPNVNLNVSCDSWTQYEARQESDRIATYWFKFIIKYDDICIIYSVQNFLFVFLDLHHAKLEVLTQRKMGRTKNCFISHNISKYDSSSCDDSCPKSN